MRREARKFLRIIGKLRNDESLKVKLDTDTLQRYHQGI